MMELNKKQDKVLESLLLNGVSSVREVQVLTGLPYDQCYTTLKSLETSGHVLIAGRDPEQKRRYLWEAVVDEEAFVQETSKEAKTKADTFTTIHPDMEPQLALVLHWNGAWYPGVKLNDGTEVVFEFKARFVYHVDGMLEVQYAK